MTATTELVVPRSIPMIFDAMIRALRFLGIFQHPSRRRVACGERV